MACVNVCVSRHLKEELSWAIDKQFRLIGMSLSEPHHMRSTVKSVFLLACLLDTSSLIWLKAIKVDNHKITSNTLVDN